MAIYQQRIPLRGSEPSIDQFTKLLKAIKEKTGRSSADALLEAISYWKKLCSASCQRLPSPPALASSRVGASHAFHLQLLTSSELQSRIQEELETLRRDPVLKSLLTKEGVGRNEFLLEALIYLLEIEWQRGQSSISLDYGFPWSRSKAHVTSEKLNSPPSQQQQQSRPSVRPAASMLLQSPSIRESPPVAQRRDAASVGKEVCELPQPHHHSLCTPVGSWQSRRLQDSSNQLVTTLGTRASSLPPPTATTTQSSANAGLGRPSNTDYGNYCHTSWRKRLRQQQVAQNKQLCEMVRRNSKKSSSKSSSSTQEQDDCQDAKQLSSPLRSRAAQPIDNRYSPWTPVHQEDIRKRLLVDDNNKENLPRRLIETSSAVPVKKQQTSGSTPAEPVSMQLSSSRLRTEYGELETGQIPTLSFKTRRERADAVSKYLWITPDEARPVPGFDRALSSSERIRAGADCDLVFPGLILGNGATLKRTDYLKQIGVTAVLNAAEFRGVNIGEDYFTAGQMPQGFQYMGLRIEDTPQTQICRYFLDVSCFLDTCLRQQASALVYVNCVFGKSRSTTCIAAYLMICHGWSADHALAHLRARRPVQLNKGFLQQIVDLEHKLNWIRGRKNLPPLA